MCTVDCKW